jgi:hypothetical protein
MQGVMEYSFSLFFTKLINYTFLYWLPTYLKNASKCKMIYFKNGKRDMLIRSEIIYIDDFAKVTRWGAKMPPTCQFCLTLVEYLVGSWPDF